MQCSCKVCILSCNLTFYFSFFLQIFYFNIYDRNKRCNVTAKFAFYRITFKCINSVCNAAAVVVASMLSITLGQNCGISNIDISVRQPVTRAIKHVAVKLLVDSRIDRRDPHRGQGEV